MQLKILKWGLFGVVLIGFATLFFQYIHQSINKTAPVESIQAQTRIGLPNRIKIPRINVDAEIEQVTVVSDGSMGVPNNPLNTAWYRLGPRPGEKGSAVIDGHIDGKFGVRGVFSDLRNLETGDKVIVQDDQGVLVSFIVHESRRYDPKADATDVFSSNDGKEHLNLITCEGVWDDVSKGYPERLVVFADKE